MDIKKGSNEADFKAVEKLSKTSIRKSCKEKSFALSLFCQTFFPMNFFAFFSPALKSALKNLRFFNSQLIFECA
jgi:hypothetical protein